ncbi:hypothetical protein SAMN05444141_106352 [Pseudovibrio denitrificans]|uniref:Uncharacterized protein n=1 Tax=Pseudovibrio denitrificans TaxID=258256 RepID=A0A1I7CS02_9HYPH|nr:hypothetical protein SAMN05444141_106352 [Pseudovibrio denitrificans]
MVIDPGSLAGMTPEATALLISTTAKSAPPQTTMPSHPMPPLRAHNPVNPTTPPDVIPGADPGPIPPVSAGNVRQQQQGTTFLSIRRFNNRLQSSNEVRISNKGGAPRGFVTLPALLITTCGYRSRLLGRDDTGGDRSAHQCHCKTSPISNHSALSPHASPQSPQP